MKKIIYLLLLATISCSTEENVAPTVPVVDVDDSEVGQIESALLHCCTAV